MEHGLLDKAATRQDKCAASRQYQMKNLYFLAAVAAFVLGSCTVEEALDPPAGPEDEAKAIGFGTFLDRVPQNGIKPLADIVDIDKLKGQGFMVEAYEHAKDDWNVWTGDKTMPNFMNAQAVKWSGGTSTSASWTYSPIQYWPGDKVSFFAYTPSPNSYTTVTFVAAGAEDKNKNPKLHYSMSPNSRLQTDLIVDAKYNLTGESDKVTFKFDHVLSRIGFKAIAQKSHEPATVTITRLEFHYGGLCRSGTYTFNSGSVTNSSDKDNKAENNWDVNGGLTGGTDGYTILPASSSFTLSTTESLDIPGSAGYLMLIPQENPAANRAYVAATYTITYPPGSGHPDVTVPSTETPDDKVYLPSIPSWEPGIAYTYTLYIAGPREMTFHIEKDNWIGWEAGGDIPIDIHDTP